MINLKEYIKESLLDDEEILMDKIDHKLLIEEWLKKYRIRDYVINDDYTIDLKGDLNLKNYNEEELPSYIQFNHVKGGVNIMNANLTTLRGLPKTVGDYCYYVHLLKLKSLEYSPTSVGETFYCFANPLITSLEGGPKKVGWGYNCSECRNLKSLEGSPRVIKGSFNCYNCPNLKNLDGCPKKVHKNFTRSKQFSVWQVKGKCDVGVHVL